MTSVPRQQASSRPAQPSGGQGLRALVDLASETAVGPSERFLLPDGPREAAAVVGAATSGAARPPVRLLSAAVALAAWAVLTVLLVAVAGPVGALLAVYAAAVWVAGRALLRAFAPGGAAGTGRGRSVTLSRADSQRIARRADAAASGLLRSAGPDEDAFAGYHQVLLHLVRFELAAGQAVAADRDRARLAPDDPLRPVAGQMAQDRAAHAVAHRAAARAAAERLESLLRSRPRP